MVTVQIMERKFRDGVIRQNHKTGWFNATDLLQVANQYRLQIGLDKRFIADYLKNDSTKEFIKTILDREDLSKAYEAKKGKGGGTWVHPLLLIDIAMWLSPDFKYEAMTWLEDRLIQNRDLSGNSFKKMALSVARYYGNEVAKAGISIPRIAKKIKDKLKVDDWNKTTEAKLKQRDEIQKNISLMLRAGVEINKACTLSLEEVAGGQE